MGYKSHVKAMGCQVMSHSYYQTVVAVTDKCAALFPFCHGSKPGGGIQDSTDIAFSAGTQCHESVFVLGKV